MGFPTRLLTILLTLLPTACAAVDLDIQGSPYEEDPRKKGCTPMLMVLAVGRSGSTTILEMLELVPQLRLRGESFALLGFSDFLGGTHNGNRMEAEEGPWEHDALDWEHVYAAWQNFYLSIIPGYPPSADEGPVVFGTKEVAGWEVEHLQEYEKLFPCARFVLSVRKDLQAESRSAFYHHTPNAFKVVTQKTAALRKWQTHLGNDRSFLMYLEDFSPGNFTSLLNWMGIEGCSYVSVLHANDHGTYHKDVGMSSHGILDGECRWGDVDVSDNFVTVWTHDFWTTRRN
jgi:hypothetical protein